MIQFEAALFFQAVEALKNRAEIIKQSNLPDSTAEGKNLVHALLDRMLEHTSVLPGAQDFHLKIRLLKDRLDRTLRTQELGILLDALHQDICVDLLKPAFLMIPERKVELFVQKEPPFGSEVVDTFASASVDVAAASRCLALDEWTACVFHSMRILEHALRRFAAEFDISMERIVDENWHNIIEMIEAKITEEQNAKRSTEKAAKLKLYSNAAINFRYFKDAWRNYVSHSKADYEELEATTIYNHVRVFTQSLAKDLPPLPASQSQPDSNGS